MTQRTISKLTDLQYVFLRFCGQKPPEGFYQGGSVTIEANDNICCGTHLCGRQQFMLYSNFIRHSISQLHHQQTHFSSCCKFQHDILPKRPGGQFPILVGLAHHLRWVSSTPFGVPLHLPVQFQNKASSPFIICK